MYDALVIGGGFFGTTIAAHLCARGRFARVLLLEREHALLSRASYNNQARVHSGYHYPRSFTTAYRSRRNLPRFIRDFPDAVRRDFTQLYAIARRNSKVTAKQFERFCREIEAPLEPAPRSLALLFDSRLIEAVFVAEEYAFDAVQLTACMSAALDHAGVEVRVGCLASHVEEAGGGLSVECRSATSDTVRVAARYLFNCTYSGLNQLWGRTARGPTALKHEITELALIQVPPPLSALGVTVMDGPFFSVMPFPARSSHTLSHVRYTPHLYWPDQPGLDPYAKMGAYEKEPRVGNMLRDAARYLPAILDARHVESLFEVKTVLAKNEVDDGRPILFERHPSLPRCYSILGGKIDNIYDVLEILDAELASAE
jgi:glycine/D-amino acid oxidase-like deaminating enzyme